MDARILNDVIRQIQRRFPEMTGVRPKVQAQRASAQRASAQGAGQANGTYLLTFQNHVRVAGGQSLPRALRVVVNEEGKILKISTSR
jgi:hypothetical protein